MRLQTVFRIYRINGRIILNLIIPEDGKVDVSLDPKQKIQVALGQEMEDVSRRDIEILTISDEVLETEFMGDVCSSK